MPDLLPSEVFVVPLDSPSFVLADGLLFQRAALSNVTLFWVGGSSTAPAVPSAPVVSNFLPLVGEPIYATTPLQFDITDVDNFTTVVVMVSFADGTYEVAYDSAVFASMYTSSTFSAITNGYRFVLHRRGGWSSSPTIKVVGVDTTGAENPQ